MVGCFLRVHHIFHNVSLNEWMRHVSKLTFTESLVHKWDQSIENKMRDDNQWICHQNTEPVLLVEALNNFETDNCLLQCCN